MLPRILLSILLMIVLAAPLAAQNARPLPSVTVAPPLAKHIRTWDEYSGRFEAVSRVEVRARVSGYIDKVHFKDGSMVKAGDLLFTIDKRPFEIAVESAKAEIARQEAQVKFAAADVERADPLVKSKVMSEQLFEQRKATLSQAQAQLLSAQAALKSAQLNLEWAEVRAPIDGRISDRKIDAGNLIAGGSADATLLATIVSLDPIHFVFEASEADYLRYSRLGLSGERPSSRNTNNPVRVRLADETTWSHEGTMDFVDNTFNQRSGTMRGRAILPNKDALFSPGMFGRLQLFGGDVNVFLVPDAAIVSDQARKIVYVVNADNVIAPKTVTLGSIYEGLRIIKDGVTIDDRIIIDGIANPAVRPGGKVAPEPGTISLASTATQN